MNAIASILTGVVPPGIYRLPLHQPAASLRGAIEQVGWRVFYLDGQAIHDKASFLTAAASAMSFPPYFGRNWDAFEECVTDLAWAPAPGYAVLYDHAVNLVTYDPAAWSTIYAIFQSAVETWSARYTPFYLLVRNIGRMPQPFITLE
jgi:hypothetical protein